jgi:hypothetical protein
MANKITIIFSNLKKNSRFLALFIAMELVGLAMILTALIIYVSFGAQHYAACIALTVIGLLLALPTLIWMIFYFLGKLFDEGNKTYISNDPINNDWFIHKRAETEEMQNEAIIEQKTLEEKISKQDEQSEDYHALLQQRAEIAARQQFLHNEAAKLEADRLELERLRVELSISKSEGNNAMMKEHEEAINRLIESQAIGQKRLQAVMVEREQLTSALLEIKQERDDKKARQQESAERRKAMEAEKRAMLARPNVEAAIKKFYAEVAACCFMERDTFKDRFGIAPFNKVVVDKTKTDSVSHTMAITETSLIKFGEILIDLDTFLKHDNLNPKFEELLSSGLTLPRISEKLHLLYLQFYSNDFVKDYRYKEDFENMLILAVFNFILKHKNLDQIFTSVPFEIDGKIDEEEMIAYLSSAQTLSAFNSMFADFDKLGFTSIAQAMITLFYHQNREKLTPATLTHAILKDTKRLEKLLSKKIK